jgi:hypothetical protein
MSTTLTEYQEKIAKSLMGIRDRAIAAKEKVEDDPKIIQIQELLSGSPFGCQNNNVRRLMTALTGKDFTVHKEEFPKMSVLVALENLNSHDYGTNPCLLVTDTRAIKPSGQMGNNLPVGGNYHDSFVRWATDEEIRGLISNPPVVSWIEQNTIIL